MGLTPTSAAVKRAQLLSGINELPPFSPILNRLLVRLAKEDVIFTEISALIEKDTVLAGNLLRLVNSALYGLAGTVNSVSHALSIIGLAKLRNIVMAVSVMRLWRREPATAGWSSAQFNLHSTATALLADLIVQHVPVEYPEGAFAAGLFHDLGKLLMAATLSLEWEALRLELESEGANFQESEQRLFGITHAELSAEALRRWRLPEAISQAVGAHHTPQRNLNGACSLGLLVHAADRTVNRLGIGFVTSQAELGPAPEEVLESVGLSTKAPRVLEEFNKQLEEARTLLS